MSAQTWRLPLHLDGRGRRAVQVTWAALMLGVMALVALGFARAWPEPELVDQPPLTDLFARFGWDDRLMIAVALVVPFAATVVIGWFVFWRRSDDPMAMAFALGMVFLYAFGTRGLLALDGLPVLQDALSAVFAIASILIAGVLAFFPDGRAVPRSARWLPLAVMTLLATRPDAGRLLMRFMDGDSTEGRLFTVSWASLMGLGLVAQAHRFRRVSGPLERQQAKWVMAPLAVAVTLTAALLVAVPLLSVEEEIVGWLLLALVPVGVLTPFCIGNAVLRHRLYDIDHVLSRTVTYLVVLVVLGGVYAAAVLAVGQALSRFGGEGSEIATAVSVLVTVVAFRPVELRVRRAIDRRFNRSGYLARHAVDAYVDSLASDIEVEVIQSRLCDVVGRAFQPTHVTVWTHDEQVQDQRSVVRSRVR